MAGKKKKLRTSFRKNREVRARGNDLTKAFDATEDGIDHLKTERLSGKGALTRKRTVAGADFVEDDSGMVVLPEIDRTGAIDHH